MSPAGQVLCAVPGSRSATWTETENGFKRIKNGKQAELAQEKDQCLYRAPEVDTEALPAAKEGDRSAVPVCAMGPHRGWNNNCAPSQLTAFLGKRQR